jgi:hydrogenase-4 transcriptional activator
MDNFKQILLDVWREAGINRETNEALERIFTLFRRHLPLTNYFIRQITPDNPVIETVFPSDSPDDTGHRPGAAELHDLDILFTQHQILAEHELPQPLRELLIPPGLQTGHRLVATIGQPAGNRTFLLLTCPPDTAITPRETGMVRLLLEPLQAVMENHHRMFELRKLREAAEADRKSLLSKLSRTDLTDIIIGADDGLQLVMERVNLVAGSDLSVLIFGETGTGKELIARTIHNRSPRADGPFIRVNCGAIPRELIDSQLFGHEKGAFTGAVETRKGWFERADGGTLFLDEVGEMPLEAQVRLLRVLQDGWLERVGGKKAIHVDVRLVLATHRDLASMVATGAFREDLWYRIATFPIFIPPLRERAADMAQLAEHFARRSAIRFGLPLCLPHSADIRVLNQYAWPGNIRELATVIDRAALLGDGHGLEIPRALGWTETMPGNRQAANRETHNPVTMSLDDAIRQHIISALIRCNGRIEGKNGCAEQLEINPHTLRAKMRKLAIDWNRYRK